MRYLCLYEDFPISEATVFQDPVYANNIFRIRFRQNTDMSNKKGSDTIPKPEDDLLDRFQIGDVVQGEDKDEKKHVGKIVSISRDEEGNGTGVTIEERGKTLELIVTTVEFYGEGEVGNKEPGRANTSKQLTDIDPTEGPSFFGTSYESMNHLIKFDNINEEQTFKFKVRNNWMDSLESASLTITSPKGGSKTVDKAGNHKKWKEEITQPMKDVLLKIAEAAEGKREYEIELTKAEAELFNQMVEILNKK